MQVTFKHSIGDIVNYYVGDNCITGVVSGLYQYKTEPTQALVEYIDSNGSVNSLWRNEHELEY